MKKQTTHKQIKALDAEIASKLYSKHKTSGIFSGNSKDFIICNIGRF